MKKPLRAAMTASTLLLALQARALRAEEAWAACIAAPTRACVLALAADAAAANSDTYQKLHVFGRLGAAEAQAGLAAEADRDFARVSAIIDAEEGIGSDVRRAQYSDALAASLADAGRTDAALALVEKIEAQYPASALAPIAARQARDGHLTLRVGDRWNSRRAQPRGGPADHEVRRLSRRGAGRARGGSDRGGKRGRERGDGGGAIQFRRLVASNSKWLTVRDFRPRFV